MLGQFDAARSYIQQFILLRQVQTLLTALVGTNTSEPWSGLLSRGNVWDTADRYRTLVTQTIDVPDYGYAPLSEPDEPGTPRNAVDDYHFGLNYPGAKSLRGPRMDHILKQHAGTVAEYDWMPFPALPNHLSGTAGIHTRLAGAPGNGIHLIRTQSAPRIDAAAGNARPYADKFSLHTRVRKQHNTQSGKVIRHRYLGPGTDVHCGVDFSKAALMDQLIRGKTVHFHLTGLKARWKPGWPLMTGSDFRDALEKKGAYESAGVAIKSHVTLRELRFIHRYWDTRKIILEPDEPASGTRSYSFKGNVIFYYQRPDKASPTRVPPPWMWGDAESGDTITNIRPGS